MDIEIAFVSFSVKARKSFFSKSENCSSLSSSFEIKRLFPDDRDFYHLGISKYCFGRRNSNGIVKMNPIASESTFFTWYLEGNVEITMTIFSTVSFSTKFNTHAIFYSSRDIDSFGYSFFRFLFPMTRRTLF